MKNLKKVNFLIVFLFAMILSANPGQALVYDTFTSPGIDPLKWYDSSADTFFTQPGKGYLNFNAPTGGQQETLRSTFRWNMPFFVAANYSNFQATNASTTPSIFNLVVGDTGNYAFVYEFKSGSSQGFQADSNNGVLSAASPSNTTKGWLGIGYNGITGAGGELTFWYDAGKGWQELATYAPNYSDAPYFLIQGKNPDGSLSFRVNEVDIFPGNLAPYKCKDLGIMVGNIASKIDNAAQETAPTAQQILSFFDNSVANATLMGKGPVASADNRRETLRKTIDKAGVLIAAGNLKAAVSQLKNAYKKTDGDSNDFVQGGAADDLAQMILDLKTSLEQTTSLASLKKMIGAANDKLADGKLKPAYNQISNAFKKSYYYSYGLVDDAAAAELAQMIQDLENSLGLTSSLAMNTSNLSQNPIPPTMLLFGSGLLGVAGLSSWRRFRRK